MCTPGPKVVLSLRRDGQCSLKCRPLSLIHPRDAADSPPKMFKLKSMVERAHESGIWCVAWYRSELLVTGSCDETIRFWDLGSFGESSSSTHTIPTYSMAITGVAAHATEPVVACGCLNGAIVVYNVAESKILAQLEGGTNNVWRVAFHPTKLLLATGTAQGAVSIWDLEAGQVTTTLKACDAHVAAVAWSSDGAVVACGGFDGSVHLFDSSSGDRVCEVKDSGHLQSVRCCAFSSDGSMLVTGCDGGRVTFVDVKTGEVSKSLIAHNNWVLGVAMHPDGVHFATASADGSVKLWDLQTRECLHTFTMPKGAFYDLAFNGDGSELAAVGDDCSIRLYTTQFTV